MLSDSIVSHFKSGLGGHLEIKIEDDHSNYIGKLSLLRINDIESDNIVESLTNWRKKFMLFFLTQFNATIDRTRSWLKNSVIPSGDKLLFLILDEKETPLGNFGIANIKGNKCELDNLIRGEKGGHPQLIYFSEIALLKWLFLQQDMSFVNLHVFSNNKPTMRLHTSVGFIEIRRNVLYKVTRDTDETHFTLENTGNSADIAPFEYVEMGIDANSFNSMHNIHG